MLKKEDIQWVQGILTEYKEKKEKNGERHYYDFESSLELFAIDGSRVNSNLIKNGKFVTYFLRDECGFGKVHKLAKSLETFRPDGIGALPLDEVNIMDVILDNDVIEEILEKKLERGWL